jgi:hypothetical protein
VAAADEWWFWAFGALLLVGSAILGRRYPALVPRVRRAAVARGLVRLGPAQRLAPAAGTVDLSWLVFPAAVWVAASPWIWGYQDSGDAVAGDLSSAAALLGLGLIAVVLPSLWALVLLPGLWLVLAPWLLGYGDANGPVGISDTVAGLVVCIGAVSGLHAAERQAVPSRGGGVGRVRRRE